MKTPPNGSRAGFTLLEVLLTAALVALILIASVGLLSSGMKTTAQSVTQGSVQEEADRVLERLGRELKDSGVTSTGWEIGINPSPADQFYGQEVTRISFSRCTGYDADMEMLQWGPVVSYQYIAADGAEPGRLVRSENGTTVTVCDNVQDFAACYDADESLMTIRVTVQRENPGSRGHFIRASYTTSVRLRN